MNDDHRPITISWGEQQALAGIERRLSDDEPALATALRHGITSPAAPPRMTLAVVLLAACLAIGVSTFAGGEPAGLAAATGLSGLGLVTAATSSMMSARRRRVGHVTAAGIRGRRARGSA